MLLKFGKTDPRLRWRAVGFYLVVRSRAPEIVMARFSLALLAVLAACALGLVTSQHQARKLFVELEREQARTKALDVEWGQLQIEASTWAALGRVEKIATERLRMRAPDPQRVRALAAPSSSAGENQ